jgi:hypothetical protein
MEIGDESESDDAEAERCGRCHDAYRLSGDQQSDRFFLFF